MFLSFRPRLADETGLEPSADVRAAGAGDRRQTSSRRSTARAADRCAATSMHEAIGEGSYGRVYAATQPGTERRVAIKVIRPDLADAAEFMRRFEAEAQLVARLEHPHIVPLYDYWREPGGAYLVFRLLAGARHGTR